MGTQYVYLSSFLDARWERRTGIPRVEYEIAREIVERGGKLITFSKMRRRFVPVDFEKDVQRIIRAQDQNLESDLHDPGNGPARLVRGTLASAAARLAAIIGGSAGATVFGLVSNSLSPQLRQSIATRMRLPANVNLAIHYLDARSQGLGGLARWVERPVPVQFQRGDAIIVPGIIWKTEPLEELARLRREHGVLITAYVHDLIPIRRPDYHTDALGVARFRAYIDGLLRCVDTFCVSSEFVAQDLRLFICENGQLEIPVYKVALCANISRGSPARSTPRLDALELEPHNFVLYVSTFSPRKNHMGAYLLWRRLFSARGSHMPSLVFAGQRGWNARDTFTQMSHDAAMRGRTIHFVEAPTDEELVTLYRNCAFTIFPSHYEGWGLPITESLAFAKPCIAADNTSLREASQGLALHIDMLDGLTWLATLARLIEDKGYRAELSAHIDANYQHRTWSQVGAEISGIAARTKEAAKAIPG